MFELNQRFRGYFPVIIDVETAGFNAQTDALLEVAAITLKMEPETGALAIDETYHAHIEPFSGANLEASALEFNGIDVNCALRGAIDEQTAMKALCKMVSKAQKSINVNAPSSLRIMRRLTKASSMLQLLGAKSNARLFIHLYRSIPPR